jgi:integrase
MSNRRVSIIERVKRNGKWVWGEKWELPVKFTLKQGSRQGKFYVLWYRGANKVLTPVPQNNGESLPDLSGALRLAKIKQRHLEDEADGLQRPDPIMPVNRVTIKEAVQKFVTQIELTKNPLTYKVYEQNLREYLEWTTLTYVDQIDKDHLFEYRKHVMDGGNERLTADWKLLRINKMVKTVLKLDHGKGPIKKSDLGKMKPNGDPDIYTPQELQAFFGACRPDEHLRYSALREAAFRKEELMYLEKDDVLVSQQMLRVKSKERRDGDGNLLYQYAAKADSERAVPISRELMDRIVRHMASHQHQLVFCTRSGKPDTHLWDKTKSVATRANLDPARFNLKKFRATQATEWLRPKWLGGFGYDMPTVKRLLGHEKDSDSVWSYVRRVENENLVAEMNKQKEKGSPLDGTSRQRKGPVVVTQKCAVAVTGVQAF